MQDDLAQVESALNELSSKIKDVFGFDPYPWQREVFMRCLRGEQDIIVTSATSDGKSLGYQGMALLHEEAIVLVISPTKALMDDQVHDQNATKFLTVDGCHYEAWIIQRLDK
jgi:superfamily II DNA helicase RecQ